MLPSYGGDCSLAIRDLMTQSLLAPTAAILPAEASSLLKLKQGYLKFAWQSETKGRVPGGFSQRAVKYNLQDKDHFHYEKSLGQRSCALKKRKCLLYERKGISTVTMSQPISSTVFVLVFYIVTIVTGKTSQIFIVLLYFSSFCFILFNVYLQVPFYSC